MSWFKRKVECVNQQLYPELDDVDIAEIKTKLKTAMVKIDGLTAQLHREENENLELLQRISKMVREQFEPISKAPMDREEMLAKVPGPDEPGLSVLLAIVEGVYNTAAAALVGPITEHGRAMEGYETGEFSVSRRGELRACLRIKNILNGLWTENDMRREENQRRASGKAQNVETDQD